VVIGNRIEANDMAFGANYSERTKKVNKLFRDEFSALRKQFEGANYFKKKLLLSFLYKEHEVIQKVKSDFEQRNILYFKLNSVIGEEAKILHMANDYGQLDVLLALQQPKRKIATFIKDEEKRAIASTNYILKNRKIEYLESICPTNGKWNTVLISLGVNADFVKQIEFDENVKQIVLIDNFELKNHFMSLGFEVDTQEKDLLVLKK
jgi:hypothetical protein